MKYLEAGLVAHMMCGFLDRLEVTSILCIPIRGKIFRGVFNSTCNAWFPGEVGSEQYIMHTNQVPRFQRGTFKKLKIWKF